MHGQSPASPEGGRFLSRVGGGVVALGQTGERHPWISLGSRHRDTQGVAGLAPRPFTLGEETGSHHVFMFIASAR